MAKSIQEVSSELLDRYKEKAKKSADELAAKGQFRKSTDRLGNVMKATGKQIEKTTASIRKALNKEEVELEENVHRIGLTVTDPKHPMVSKRKETIQKTVRVKGPDKEKAITSAIMHYRRKGYKVHDHHYIGTVNEISQQAHDKYMSSAVSDYGHQNFMKRVAQGDTQKAAAARQDKRAKGIALSVKLTTRKNLQKESYKEEQMNVKEGNNNSDPLANRASYAKQHGTGQVYKKTYPGDKIGMTKSHAYDIKRTGPKGKLPEELEHVDEASLTTGKRLISKHGEGSHTARVYKDTEYNEYQVHHYKDGKHMGEGPVSYHSDKEDAENTAKMSLRKQMKEDVEQLDEKLPASATAGDYIRDFKKSNAPQFKGKSKEKRRIMGIAAYLQAKKGMNESSAEFEKEMDDLNKARLQRLKSEKQVNDFKAKKDKAEADRSNIQMIARKKASSDSASVKGREQSILKMNESDLCPECMEEPCVCDNIQEAVTVKKQNYSWGKMITVHKGADTSYPLHPEHQKAIRDLRPSGVNSKTSFKDETGRRVHATREGDKVHLVSHGATSDKTTVDYKHFDESNMKTFKTLMQDIDEGRGRPRKNPTDPKWSKGKTKSGDDEDHDYGGSDSGKEPDQHVHVQLSKAADAKAHEVKGKEGFKTKGGADVKFDNGKTHFVKAEHAHAVLSALQKVKPEARSQLHNHIAQSHDNFMAVHKMVSGGK